MRLRVMMSVRAPPGAVYAWWTDFREEDSQLSGRILAARRHVRRSGNVVTFEDEGRMLGVWYRDVVEVQLLPPNRWTARYRSSRFAAFSTYVVEPHPEGSRLTVETTVRFRGWLRLFGWLAKPLIERRIAQEWTAYRTLIEGTPRPRTPSEVGTPTPLGPGL